ncbi:MAG: DMT family transporter [Candidatus Bipolaricaulaceae bacterium]
MGYLAMIAAAALWGLIGPVSRLAFQEGLSPLEVAFFRGLLAWVLFAVQGFWRQEIRVRAQDLPLFLPFGLVGIALFYGSYQLAIRLGGAALASVLLYTAPVWVVLLAPWALAEPLTPSKGFAVGLALVGIALVGSAAGLRFHPLGLGFGLLSGFTYALYYLFGKRFLTGYPTSYVFFCALPIGCLALLPFVEFHPKTILAWGAVGFLAVFSTYGAYSAYLAGLRRLPASQAVLLATLEPVVAVVVAHLWWRETFTLAQGIGALCILAAATLGSGACRTKSASV